MSRRSRTSPPPCSRPVDPPGSAQSWPRIAAAALLVALATLAVPLAHDVGRPYWTTPDADLIFAYQGLMLAETAPQTLFEHPGYIYYLLLAGWLHLMHALGLLPVHTVTALSQLPAGPWFDDMLTRVVVSGRVLGMVLSVAFAALILAAVRRLTGSLAVALAAALVFATGRGTARAAMELHTELPSALLVTLAVLAVIGAARRTGRPALVLLAAAGFAAMLAVQAKLQAILPLLGLPVIAFAFGRSWRECSDTRPWRGTLGLAAIGAVVAVPAGLTFAAGLVDLDIAPSYYEYRRSPLPALAIIGLLAGACALYARVYRVPGHWAVRGVIALFAGLAAGEIVMLAWFAKPNIDAVTNFLEHMTMFGSDASRTGGILPALGQAAAAMVEQRLLAPSFLRDPQHLPQWLAAGAILWQWRRGDRRVAVQAAVLLALALGAEALFHLRYVAERFRIYLDPFTALALGLAVAGLPWGRWARLAGAAAVAACLALALMQGVEPGFVDRQPLDNTCRQGRFYAPAFTAQLERFCR